MDRGAANLPELKGGNPLSERHSIFREEVTTCWDGRPIPGAQKNTRLLETLLSADQVILVGFAFSHCVKESITDLLADIQAKDSRLARKVYVMEDCTTAVVISGGPDFTDEATRALRRFADAGMHMVRSTEPMESWPDERL